MGQSREDAALAQEPRFDIVEVEAAPDQLDGDVLAEVGTFAHGAVDDAHAAAADALGDAERAEHRADQRVGGFARRVGEFFRIVFVRIADAAQQRGDLGAQRRVAAAAAFDECIARRGIGVERIAQDLQRLAIALVHQRAAAERVSPARPASRLTRRPAVRAAIRAQPPSRAAQCVR